MLTTGEGMEWIKMFKNLRQKWIKRRAEKREAADKKAQARSNQRRWAAYFSGIRHEG